jgi:hypothetical protein
LLYYTNLNHRELENARSEKTVAFERAKSRLSEFKLNPSSHKKLRLLREKCSENIEP